MSNPQDRQWTEDEKYTLLTEILKKAGVHSSHLVKLIRDFNINPSWNDIPLPAGRSVTSCQNAFYTMYNQHAQYSVNPGYGRFPPPRHEIAPPVAPMDSSHHRKRLLPSDRPILAPRAIQPRPVTSTASYSSESGASVLVSPSSETIPRGEPPRKRGRPSKAESQRRKAEAEARGEPYPPPRRSGSNKIKAPSAPTSPASTEPLSASFAPPGSSRPSTLPQLDLRYTLPPGRPIAPLGVGDDERARELPNPETTMRELPRPAEMRQTLPSPQMLQLGHRESISRIDPAERPFEPLPPERLSFGDSSRRSLVHPSNSRPHDSTPSAPEIPYSTPTERRTE